VFYRATGGVDCCVETERSFEGKRELDVRIAEARSFVGEEPDYIALGWRVHQKIRHEKRSR
jgi:hypothetical protein